MQIVDIEYANIDHGTALALGYFDTFHTGHQLLLSRVKESGYIPSMFTFEGDFYGALGLSLLPIYSWQERMRLAEQYGMQYVFTMPADQRHLSISPEDFLRLLLTAKPAMIVCGADFRFGKFAVAGVEQLQVFCAEQGIEFCALPLLKDDKGRKIGTFGIREALVDGDMPRVETYLGRCYTLEGTVEHGRADGKRLGFPTANFQLDSHYQSPAMGVYACAVWVDDRWYAGVCNLGAHPTLGDMSVNVECHLLHYSGDLYGRKIRVRLHRKLRDIRRFESEEALHAQIKKDCMMAEYVYGGIYD